MKRRDFLKGASMLSLGALATGCTNPAKEGTATAIHAVGNKNMGLQIYTLGNELYAEDFSANLKRIANMGIRNLELAGYDPADRKIGGIERTEFKKMAEDAGLNIVSSHVNPPTVFSGAAGRENRTGRDGYFSGDMKSEIVESFKQIADDHAELGIEYLIQPMMPKEGINNINDVKVFCDTLNATGEEIKKHGVTFGYHNHNMEFCKVSDNSTSRFMGDILTRPYVEGEQIIDIMMRETHPDLVKFEMDTYWTIMGQNDPVAMLTKYADRIELLHIKDFVVLGESGALNFQNIFNKFFENGNQYYFIEIEDIDSGKQFERLEKSANWLAQQDYVK